MVILNESHFKNHQDLIQEEITRFENSNKTNNERVSKALNEKHIENCKKFKDEINNNLNKFKGKPIGINFFNRLNQNFDDLSVSLQNVNILADYLEKLRDMTNLVSDMQFSSNIVFEDSHISSKINIYKTLFIGLLVGIVPIILVPVAMYFFTQKFTVLLLIIILEIPILFLLYKILKRFFDTFIQINYLSFINNGISFLSKSPLGVNSKSERVLEQTISEFLKSLPKYKDSTKKNILKN